ncbi:hypothetical protein [Aquimarina rhabdastrellae]
MKDTFIGYKVKLIDSSKTGIVFKLNSQVINQSLDKYIVSFDNEIRIEQLTEEKLHFEEEISKTILFKRLIRDIRSFEIKTREVVSLLLCDFIEIEVTDFDLEVLKDGVEQMIQQIKEEKNINIEQKLVEGVFEFIWHKKMSKNEEIELLERLTEIDKYYVWSYLGDELDDDITKYSSNKLNNYYSENIHKWNEKDREIYGKEKIERYYNK